MKSAHRFSLLNLKLRVSIPETTIFAITAIQNRKNVGASSQFATNQLPTLHLRSFLQVTLPKVPLSFIGWRPLPEIPFTMKLPNFSELCTGIAVNK